MNKDNSEINKYNHSISLLERKTLVLTGVKKIDNFDKENFIVDSSMGIIVIKGEELELIKLDTLSGNLTIKGVIFSIEYFDETKKKSKENSILSRLFK